MADLIRCLQQENTQEEAVVAFVEKKKGMFSCAQVEDVITRLIQPMFADGEKSRKRTFLYERELFSASAFADHYTIGFNYMAGIKQVHDSLGLRNSNFQLNIGYQF